MSLVYPWQKKFYKRQRPSKEKMKKFEEFIKMYNKRKRDKKQLEDAIKNNPDVWDAEKFEEMEREKKKKKKRKRDVKQPKGSI